MGDTVFLMVLGIVILAVAVIASTASQALLAVLLIAGTPCALLAIFVAVCKS